MHEMWGKPRALSIAFFAAIINTSWQSCLADEHIVSPPVTNDTSLPERMLLYIPGGDVPNQHYLATVQAVQHSLAKDVRLWAAIPAVLKRLCILSCTAPGLCGPLQGDVEDALKQAVKQGWKRGDDSNELWVAGHSLGGICANTLFQAGTKEPANYPYAGVIVMGSYVDASGEHDVLHYPKPVLTLNAELDAGSARPGKTAIWWQQHLELSKTLGEEAALESKPVIILPKMNHSDFCPGFDVPGDLMAEIDQNAATESIGDAIGAFLAVQTLASGTVKQAYTEKLATYVDWTRKLLTPYLQAQAMEYSTLDVTASAEGTSPLCAHVQHLIAGLPKDDDARLEVSDGFHGAISDLEHCHPNWTLTGTNMRGAAKLKVSSCSHTEYYGNFLNRGEITAASEVACKMLSSARVAEQLGRSESPYVQCLEGNRYAVQVAESLALTSTFARYKSKGRGICLNKDVETFLDVGPIWVFKDRLKIEENSTCLGVTSVFLRTALNSSIYPGSHYCKLLSPARVLDWMMSDSLKPGAKPDSVIWS